ncbi:flagellar hook-basal body complex protein FliE [Colwellia sp. MEBiC06753]
MEIESIQSVSLQNSSTLEGLSKSTNLSKSNNDLEIAPFGQALLEKVDNINQEIVAADNLLQQKALGKDVNTHELVLALETAKLSLQLTVEVRNKVLEGYHDVMRMQL